jgi:hypothetical protein
VNRNTQIEGVKHNTKVRLFLGSKMHKVLKKTCIHKNNKIVETKCKASNISFNPLVHNMGLLNLDQTIKSKLKFENWIELKLMATFIFNLISP